jgi:hypothetical protein
MAKGIRRIKGGWGDQDSVLVKYPDGAEMEIPASQYLANRDIIHPSMRCRCALPPKLRLARRATPKRRSPSGEKRPTDANRRALMIA